MLTPSPMVRRLWVLERFRQALGGGPVGSIAVAPAAAALVVDPSPDADGTARVSGLQPADRARELLPLFGLCLYAVVVVKAGWVADDAFASFRAAVHLVDGHGLLSNVPERVQAFTNPLWTLVFALGYSLVRDAYAVAMVLSLVCSIATVALIAFSRRVDVLPRLLAVVALCLSSAFVDFSTSGLENPLAHLLIVLIYASARRERSTFVIALFSALLAVNRLDHVLLVTPLLVSRLVRAGRRGFPRELGRVALGFLPLAAWLVFAIVYYGFPFPNTAYSKLNVTISSAQFFAQGIWYGVETVTRDPSTALLISAGIAAPFVTRNWRLLPFSLGIALYVLYVFRVGGDFMQGRFFSVPFVLAVVLLFHDVVPALSPRFELVVGAIVVLVPLAASSSRLGNPDTPTCTVPESGVADERACYRSHTGLIANVRISKYKKHEYYERGRGFRKKGPAVHALNVGGMEAFPAGPEVHLVDTWGLTDPLLARIPYQPNDAHWRIGHFSRALPDGYVDSVRSGRNRIKDKCLARYYELLHNVTSGPVFSWTRFKNIYWLNFVERTTAGCKKSR